MSNEGLISVKPLIMRQLVWDMIPHEDVNEVMQSLHLLPGSEENFELEHLDAHKRDFVIQPNSPVVMQIIGMAVEVIAHYYKCKDTVPDWMRNDNDFVEVQRLVHAIVMGVLTSISTTDVLRMPVVNLSDNTGEQDE